MGYDGDSAYIGSGFDHISSGACSRVGKLHSVLERLFVFLLVLSSMNVITALSPSSREQAEIKMFTADVSTSTIIIEGAIYAYGGILILMRWRRVLRAALTAWHIPALAVLASLSTAWSVQPEVTLRRSVALLAATTIAVYLGERYSIKEFARLLAQTLCLMLTLVLVVYWIAPGYVVNYSAYWGAWRGLSADKNTFGEHMAVAVSLLALIRFRRFRWTRYAFLLIAAGLLLLSRSATALVCGVLGLAAIPLWRLLRSKQRLPAYLLVFSMFSLGILFLFAFPEPIFHILGRDATLTGRTHLWAVLLPAIANRPVLGYGYAAFWAGLKPEVLSVWIAVGHLVPIADNGYIDLCLSLGAVGVIFFLYVFVQTFRKAIEYVTLARGFIGIWPVTYLCIFAADSFSESALLTRGTFSFLVFAILVTSLTVDRTRRVAARRAADNQPFIWESATPVTSR
jgi:exopolysaccharide production protein ExoQ